MGDPKFDWKKVQVRFDEHGRLHVKGKADDVRPLLWRGKVQELGNDEYIVRQFRPDPVIIFPDYECLCPWFDDMKSGVSGKILERKKRGDEANT